MSALLEKIRNVEFTGLNRAFGGGKHHASVYEDRGIRGGPQRMSSSDDSDSSRLPRLVGRGCQIFFAFISLAIALAIIIFQSSNDVGVSGLSGLNIFVIIQALLVSAFLLVVPIVAERWGKMRGLDRALGQIRVGFIVEVTESVLVVLLAVINSISANVKGCSDPNKDPHADKEGYKDKLPGFCRNKRALTAFLWFSFGAWLVTLILLLLRWKSIRKYGNSHAPFQPPTDQDAEDEPFDARDDNIEHPYDEPYSPPSAGAPVYSNQAQSRPSETFYDNGRRPFDDQAPVGYSQTVNPFSDTSYAEPPQPPRYTDPYEQISARLRREELDHQQAPQLPQLEYQR